MNKSEHGIIGLFFRKLSIESGMIVCVIVNTILCTDNYYNSRRNGTSKINNILIEQISERLHLIYNVAFVEK